MDENNALRSQILQCLVESGQYETISNSLSHKLLQDGWVDEVKHLTNEQIKKQGIMGKYTELLKAVEPAATGK